MYIGISFLLHFFDFEFIKGTTNFNFLNSINYRAGLETVGRNLNLREKTNRLCNTVFYLNEINKIEITSVTSFVPVPY